jgi:hypothetical protein
MELQNKQSKTVTVTREEYEALFHAFQDRIELVDRWQGWLDAIVVGFAAVFVLGGVVMLVWTRMGGYDLALVWASGTVAIMLEIRMRYKTRKRRRTRQ